MTPQQDAATEAIEKALNLIAQAMMEMVKAQAADPSRSSRWLDGSDDAWELLRQARASLIAQDDTSLSQ